MCAEARITSSIPVHSVFGNYEPPCAWIIYQRQVYDQSHHQFGCTYRHSGGVYVRIDGHICLHTKPVAHYVCHNWRYDWAIYLQRDLGLLVSAASSEC